MARHYGVSVEITGHLFAGEMVSAVNLDNRAALWMVEVRDPSKDYRLTPKT